MGTKLNQSLLIGLGAMWGIVEATLGWGMHLLHVPFRSLLLFPIGLMFMLYGVCRVGEARAALRIATVAALIKLSNLLMPGMFPAYYVVNPAVAIWLEGIAVFVFSYFFITRPKAKHVGLFYSFMGTLTLVVLMEFAFSGWQFIASGLTEVNPVLAYKFSLGNIIPFTIQSLLKGILFLGVVRLMETLSEKGWQSRFSWTVAVSLVIVAIFVNHITL